MLSERGQNQMAALQSSISMFLGHSGTGRKTEVIARGMSGVRDYLYRGMRIWGGDIMCLNWGGAYDNS